MGLDFRQAAGASDFADLGFQPLRQPVGSISLQAVQVWRYRVRLPLNTIRGLVVYDPNVLAVWGFRR